MARSRDNTRRAAGRIAGVLVADALREAFFLLRRRAISARLANRLTVSPLTNGRAPTRIGHGEQVGAGVVREAGEPLEGIGDGAQPIQEVVAIPREPAEGIGRGGEAGDVVVRPGSGTTQGVGARGELAGVFAETSETVYRCPGLQGNKGSRVPYERPSGSTKLSRFPRTYA